MNIHFWPKTEKAENDQIAHFQCRTKASFGRLLVWLAWPEWPWSPQILRQMPLDVDVIRQTSVLVPSLVQNRQQYRTILIQLLSTMVFYQKNRQITETLPRHSTSKVVFDQFQLWEWTLTGCNGHWQRQQEQVACRPYRHHRRWKKVHGNQLATDRQLPEW